MAATFKLRTPRRLPSPYGRATPQPAARAIARCATARPPAEAGDTAHLWAAATALRTNPADAAELPDERLAWPRLSPGGPPRLARPPQARHTLAPSSR
jgi:hypothetical protein